jgi:hypothetical protein
MNNTTNEKNATQQIEDVAELHEAELESIVGAALPDPEKPHCPKWPNTSQTWGF